MGVFTEVAERFRQSESRNGTGRDKRPPSINDLLMASSKAMDLLEGKPMRSGIKVAVIAGSIARLMLLPEREATSIIYAALLHDIGLARFVPDLYSHLPPGVSEKQLFQAHALYNAGLIDHPPEFFSNELFELFHQHPLTAKDFVLRMHVSQDVADLIAAHHELCDGSGYPLGLTQARIPLGSRILAFADVVEGMLEWTTREVSGLSQRRQVLESFLEIKAPGKFDANVIRIFQNLIQENEDFLKMITSLEVENMLRNLLPERVTALWGGTLLSVVETMGTLSDSVMSFYKAGRSRRLADLAVELAESLGIHREQCGQLAMAAMLMDIGHLGTPAAMLFKPGLLTSDERAVMHDHPLWTEEILKGVPGFEHVILWASEHHERMNGKGYPGHKKTLEISIGGRILALADVFDALTSHRPYRAQAHEPLDALPLISQGRMTLYDNQLVHLLRKVILNREIALR